MSTGLADFLIAVSEPSELKAYKSDPINYMSRFGLSRGDMEALKSGKTGWIRLQAKSEADFSEDHPAVIASSAVGEMQVALVMEVTEIFEASRNNMGAEADREMTAFEDERGKLFRALPAS